MNSQLFKLNSGDFLKGLVTAIFAAVVVSLGSVFSQNGFDLWSADWGAIFHTASNVSVSVFVAYLAKNFLSDGSGKVLGKIG